MAMEGKVGIVTGAGSGIGAAIATELYKGGVKIAAFDLDGAAAAVTAATFQEGIAVPVDVAESASVEAAVEQVLENFGRIDILANNAGIFDGFANLEETTEELWTRVLSVNLTGQYLMARAVIPTMLNQGEGVIVNTASVSAIVGGAGGPAYTVSKHGVLGLTRALAHEFGPKGIRVNAVGPGAMATPMSATAMAAGDEGVKRTAAGRWGEPREIGEVVAFLAGDGASFMHGSLVMADGGYTLT